MSDDPKPDNSLIFFIVGVLLLLAGGVILSADLGGSAGGIGTIALFVGLVASVYGAGKVFSKDEK